MDLHFFEYSLPVGLTKLSLSKIYFFLCQCVLRRSVTGRVINGACSSKVLSYCCDKSCMLFHGLNTRYENSMSDLNFVELIAAYFR